MDKVDQIIDEVHEKIEVVFTGISGIKGSFISFGIAKTLQLFKKCKKRKTNIQKDEK